LLNKNVFCVNGTFTAVNTKFFNVVKLKNKFMKSIFTFTICAVLLSINYGETKGQSPTNPIDPTVWKFKTSGAIYSTPLIHNDTIFIGSLDSCFYAIDRQTGQQAWKYKTKSQINTTASIFGNIICFGSGNYLYAIDTKGNLKWEFKMYDGIGVIQNDAWDYFNSSPNIVDTVAYIGTEKGLVYGVNIITGLQVFKCQAADLNYTVETTPVIYDGKVFFGDWNGFFYAYDLKTSQKVWEYDTNLDNKQRPAGGTPVNTSAAPVELIAHAILYNGNVYFGGRGGYFYCFNPKTGEKKWQYRDPSGLWILGLTLKDSTFYMGSSYQFIARAVNANTGVGIWTTTIDYISYGSPWADTTYLFTGTGNDQATNKGTLFAINKETGVVKTKLSVDGRIQSSPILYNNILYFGCSNGYVYSVDKQKLISAKYSKIVIKEKKTINLNNRPLNSTFDTSIYIFNIGDATDSISFSSNKKEMTIIPSWTYLNPGDSIKINVSINSTGLDPKQYSYTFLAKSHYSLNKETFSEYYNFVLITDMSSTEILNKSKELQLFPNPFNGLGTIEYRLNSNSNICISIYDGSGKEIAILEKGFKTSGIHQLIFDSSNLSNGTYFCKLMAGKNSTTQKMIILK
jgi:eukaryotic-like serine/threonine-protein kinase